MTGFQEKDGVLHADNVALPDLTEAYGTPLYVYSAGRIKENVNRLQEALLSALPADRQPLIAFACKANSNLAVLKMLSGLGLGCDVVSGGEMTRALRAGIAADKIVYSGVGKSDEEIAAALVNNIQQINVESGAELERIAGIAQKLRKQARITFRFNPEVEAGTHDKISTGRRADKFGLFREEIEELYPWAAAHENLAPQGLHIHIGSQLTAMEPYRLAYEKLAVFADELKSKGLPVDMLDLGGGLGIVYRDETPPDVASFAKMIAEIIAPLGTRMILEPGRFITGDAGLLLSRVSYIKQREDRSYIILDAGMNDLMRPALYDAYHPIRPVTARAGALRRYDIAGPVCETGDTFIRNHEMPPIEKDDLVAIMCAGAYGYVMASNYNTRPLPAEVLADGDKHAIIGRRQTIQDILEKEHIPDWL